VRDTRISPGCVSAAMLPAIFDRGADDTAAAAAELHVARVDASASSHYERDARPRGVEVESALIHFGLSMFVTFDAAAERATRWPALGTNIAHMRSSRATASTSLKRAPACTAPSGAAPCSCSLMWPISCL
jgi:hypothetical protein